MLAAALAGNADVDATLSLAGRTAAPAASPIATRVGGFGGLDGLVSYIRKEAVDILVDATHPFAAQISRHAREASRLAGCRLIDFTRPPWTPRTGDRWTEVATMVDAAAALGPEPRRVFLTVGRLQLAAFKSAPHHHYLVRTIDSVGADHGLACASFVRQRGPFEADKEEKLMRDHLIEVLVAKNSGGSASAPKLAAARRLGLPVVLVKRPRAADDGANNVDDVLAAIAAHRALACRGV